MVKSSEPTRIMAKLSARTIAWIAKILLEGSGAASRIESLDYDFQSMFFRKKSPKAIQLNREMMFIIFVEDSDSPNDRESVADR